MKLTPYHAKFYAYDILRKNRTDIATILFNAKLQMNPHQVIVAQFALKSSLSKGVILADEIGLDKTIEAGLILAQLRAERKRKLDESRQEGEQQIDDENVELLSSYQI